MAGRKKLPTKLKALRGTNRADRANKNEPQPKVATVACPYKLNPRARVAWDELANELIETRVLTEADLQALKLLCESIAEYDSLYIKLWEKQPNGKMEYVPVQKFYEIYEKGSKKKLTIPNLIATKIKLEVSLMAENRKFQKMMLTEFGLTPSSRAKVTTRQPLGSGGGKSKLQILREGREARRRARKKE